MQPVKRFHWESAEYAEAFATLGDVTVKYFG